MSLYHSFGRGGLDDCRERQAFFDTLFPIRFTLMNATDWVRRFFEQQLAGLEGEVQRLLPGVRLPMQHLVAHLVEQTVQRAAADAATHGGRESEEVSWERCVMVAALAEMRAIKLLARNQM